MPKLTDAEHAEARDTIAAALKQFDAYGAYAHHHIIGYLTAFIARRGLADELADELASSFAASPAPVPATDPPAENQKVVDLMEALARAVDAAKEARRRHPHPRSA